MNKTVLTILATLAMLSAGCSDGGARAQEKKANPTFMFWCFRKEIVSASYHVPEMTTPAAATYLQNIVRSVPGYDSSSADLDNRTLAVRYQSSTIRKMNFEEAIALAGFSVNGRPANPAAAKKLSEGIK
jgi:hypothetical protein